MTFAIISTGWQCADWIEQTLASVEAQSVDDWIIYIVYDPSDDDGADRIRSWCDQRDGRWGYQINTKRQRSVHNQVEAIRLLELDDTDVIVWLDLDGDMFAHEHVLAKLQKVYAAPDGPLVTFGSYRSVPYVPTSLPARPIPDHVVKERSYRIETLRSGPYWNHLRTMQAQVFRAIPDSHFRWPSGPLKGQYYGSACDYIMMTAALELADGRHQFIDETLLLYRHGPVDGPELAAKRADDPADACTQNYLRRPPLAPLP